MIDLKLRGEVNSFLYNSFLLMLFITSVEKQNKIVGLVFPMEDTSEGTDNGVG